VQDTLEGLLDGVAMSKTTKLTLHECGLCATHIPVITDALKRMNVTSLSLYGNKFTTLDQLQIISASKGLSLECLDLIGNKKAQGVVMLAMMR
jgi:hypothetical protein